MGNSARVAYVRLQRMKQADRIGFEDWKDRVRVALHLRGYDLADFPHMPLERLYRAGHRAVRVGEAIADGQDEARRKGRANR